MGETLRRLRETKMRAQGGLCYYCGQPMWTGDREAFARTHGIALGMAAWFRCTAEHLRARYEGGRHEAGNVVAACLFCNRTRHKAKSPLDPMAYRNRVRQKMAAGHWMRLPGGPEPVNARPAVAPRRPRPGRRP